MIKKIEKEQCVCDVCGYTWMPRTEGDFPIKCPSPRCQSYKWNDRKIIER